MMGLRRFWRTPEGPSLNGTFCKIPNPRRKRMARTKMAKIRTKRMTKKTKRRRKRMKRKSRSNQNIAKCKANSSSIQSQKPKPNRLVILLLSTFYFQFFRSLILYTISVSTIEPLEGASIFHHSEALFENWLLNITDIDVKLFMMYQ